MLDQAITTFRTQFSEIKNMLFLKDKKFSLSLKKHCLYVDEFISNSIHHYISGLLSILRSKDTPKNSESDKALCSIIINETNHRRSLTLEPEKFDDKDSAKSEFIFYRGGLLNKFVLDALLLNTSRTSPHKKLKNVIGSFAAGIAMLVYFVLFIWQGTVFLINSEAFILTTVVLYILKDRLKEGLKTLSYSFAF